MTLDNVLYREDIQYTSEIDLPWEKLSDKSIVITGASGLVGSYLVDVIMYRNRYREMRCKLYAIGRDIEKAKDRFAEYWESDWFKFISHDINDPLDLESFGIGGYILHMASNTHPMAYATDPIGTISSNIIGTKNLLDFAVKHAADRFVFVSSNEIYGENRGDTEFFDESYCGYIDSNTLRAGYPESKRCGESLCQAYRKQKGMDIVISRLTRSYGPTMLMTDTKAVSQFVRKGVEGEDIVLKSLGTQYYSYLYVADAVSGILTVMLKGKNGEAFNIADISSDITLRDLADMIAGMAGKKVVFELPDDEEKSGYSTATKARLDGSKLKTIGWNSRYDIKRGMERTIKILKSI